MSSGSNYKGRYKHPLHRERSVLENTRRLKEINYKLFADIYIKPVLKKIFVERKVDKLEANEVSLIKRHVTQYYIYNWFEFVKLQKREGLEEGEVLTLVPGFLRKGTSLSYPLKSHVLDTKSRDGIVIIDDSGRHRFDVPNEHLKYFITERLSEIMKEMSSHAVDFVARYIYDHFQKYNALRK